MVEEKGPPSKVMESMFERRETPLAEEADTLSSDRLSHLRQGFRSAFHHFRQRPSNRGRPPRPAIAQDRTRTLIWLMLGCLAMGFGFLAIFSRPMGNRAKVVVERGQPNLGRKQAPGSSLAKPQEAGSMTPLLSADVRVSPEWEAGLVTENDIRSTVQRSPEQENQRAEKSVQPRKQTKPYSLRQTEVFDPRSGKAESLAEVEARIAGLESRIQATSLASKGTGPLASEPLAKPSLVYVHSGTPEGGSNPMSMRDSHLRPPVGQLEWLNLPSGTKLMARLQSAVSSAVAVPVVAVIEYNYERHGEIVLPAGSKVFGKVRQANQSGHVNLEFDSLQMPSGETVRIDGAGLDLSLRPLKGNVEGRKRGTRFLVRGLTGIGVVASQTLGLRGGLSGLNSPITQGALLRDRLSNNIAQAADQQLQELAINQNVVVTIPANTRFYIVLQKPLGPQTAEAPQGKGGSYVATTEQEGPALTRQELRQLKELKQELTRLLVASGPGHQNAP